MARRQRDKQHEQVPVETRCHFSLSEWPCGTLSNSPSQLCRVESCCMQFPRSLIPGGDAFGSLCPSVRQIATCARECGWRQWMSS
jgi:hypothetical protein